MNFGGASIVVGVIYCHLKFSVGQGPRLCNLSSPVFDGKLYYTLPPDIPRTVPCGIGSWLHTGKIEVSEKKNHGF